MRHYPILLDIRSRYCLVVGGGAVGTRKVKTLLDCGALVTVVSPETSQDLKILAAQGVLRLRQRRFREKDLEGMFLVIGATDDKTVNRRIGEAAVQRNMLCNIADPPEKSNYIVPSVLRRGDLMVSISTGGKSPAMAKQIREEMESRFGEEYARLLRLMGVIRQRLLILEPAHNRRKEMFEQLVAENLIELIREDRIEEIDLLLRRVLGEGFQYHALMAEARDCS